MNRRNFLKLIATVPAVAAVPSLAFVNESAPVQKNQHALGRVREMIAYDMNTDKTIVRHDVSNGRVQLGLDQVLARGREPVTEEAKKKARDIAVKMLLEDMTKEGISVNDLIRLPAIA